MESIYLNSTTLARMADDAAAGDKARLTALADLFTQRPAMAAVQAAITEPMYQACKAVIDRKAWLALPAEYRQNPKKAVKADLFRALAQVPVSTKEFKASRSGRTKPTEDQKAFRVWVNFYNHVLNHSVVAEAHGAKRKARGGSKGPTFMGLVKYTANLFTLVGSKGLTAEELACVDTVVEFLTEERTKRTAPAAIAPAA